MDHVLFRCKEFSVERDRLKTQPGGLGNIWPCSTRVFLDTKSNYQCLVGFAKEAIRVKQTSGRENHQEDD